MLFNTKNVIYIIFLIHLFSQLVRADVEQTFANCCALGANWARDSKGCETYPQSVPGQPLKLQYICRTTLLVCCERFRRESKCEQGKLSAKAGSTCSKLRGPEHEFDKSNIQQDCCIGCKLGIVTGNIVRECNLKGFSLGAPWHEAFSECCNYKSLSNQKNNSSTKTLPVTELNSKNLCEAFPGQLCGHICVPSEGSYTCQCREGFKLSVDGKTCVQDHVSDRCQITNPCEHNCIDTGVSIECSCNVGFKLRQDKRTCEDVDECGTITGICGQSSSCSNTIGSFHCLPYLKGDCPTGFYFDSNHQSCLDNDECILNTHDCGTQEMCVNTKGGFKCKLQEAEPECEDGYELNFRTAKCEDVDECIVGGHLCESNEETCVNLPGSYECKKNEQEVTTARNEVLNLLTSSKSPTSSTLRDKQCPNGYSFSEAYNTCKDINECMVGLHTCDNFQRCDNTLGSYSCTRISGCGTGYTLNHNTGNCDDDDECELGIHHCRQLGPKWRCVNTKGSFRCEKKSCPEHQTLNSYGFCVNITCSPGFKPLNGDCADVDECLEGQYPCKRNERCFNFIGSFECRPKIICASGYKMNEVGSQCEDIDECKDNKSSCHGNQTCVNRPGGFACQCPPGFRLNADRQCQDVNECQTAFRRLCGNTGVCVNTIGSYHCRCKEGFRKGENGEKCVDVNECTDEAIRCDHNCINLWGSFYCTCNSGFRIGPDKRTCVDIDECEEVLGKGRLCLGFCVNIPGSFKCSCPSGYSLNEDQRTCKDINECDTYSTCPNPNDVCVNVRGGFKCREINCPAGYITDAKHNNRCKKEKTCLVNDHECLEKPLTYSYNFLPLASNMTLQPKGHVDLFTMRGPLWSSTNVQFDLSIESVETGSSKIPPAIKENFSLSKSAFNQVVLRLVRPLQGPQEILLNLHMNLYHNGYFEGSAVAKLLIIVSQYDF